MNSVQAAASQENSTLPPSSLSIGQDRSVDHFIQAMQPVLAGLNVEIAAVEVQNHHGKVLRIFIDRAPVQNDQGEWIYAHDEQKGGVSLDDCAAVSRALDEPLESNAQVQVWFKGPYDLEVSSPGIDRPLRTVRDFQRFSGRDARIHLFRPCTAEELKNAEYQAKNSKQKNYLGVIQGCDATHVQMGLASEGGRTQDTKKELTQVWIPMALISKAHLEPQFDFNDSGKVENET